MKRGCQQVESLFAAYVDQEAGVAERATVDAHLRACPPCRDRIAGERAAREVLRARGAALRPCASHALRARCAAHGTPAATRSALLTRRALIPLSLAAAVLLAVSSTLFFFGNTVEVLAAQLAVDHVKCFQFAPGGTTPVSVDPLAEAKKWEAKYGWPLKVPASAASEELELIAVRRCLSSEGRIAHMMYRWHGQPLSVFVLNSRPAARKNDQPGEIEEVVSKMGENTVIWSRGDRTYAVVARSLSPDLQQVARYVRRASE